jgi:hypothetical protein
MNDTYKQKYIKYKTKYVNLKQQQGFRSNRALEYSDWMKYAKDNNLFFGPKDYADLEPGKKYYAVQIDYIRFLSIEYPDRHNIKIDKIYDPVDFFNKFKSGLTATGNITKKRKPVIRQRGKNKCCAALEENVASYEVIVDPYYDKSFGNDKEFKMDLSHVESNWLSSGSGDGYSRWMLWNNVAIMPKFYFTSPKD